jgi:hypothetical protein
MQIYWKYSTGKSWSVCMILLCAIIQMLHFELTLILLLLLLVYCYVFESMVVPFTIVITLMKGQWLSQILSSREIQQHLTTLTLLTATISIIFPVILLMLPAMVVRTHSAVLPIIGQLISVSRSYEIGQAAGRRCVVCVLLRRCMCCVCEEWCAWSG